VGLERRVLFERELRELEYGLLSLVSLAAKALLFSVVCLQRISRGLRRSFGRQKKVTKNSRLRLLLRFVVLLPQLCLPNQTMPVWAVNGEVVLLLLKRLRADVMLSFSKYVGWANDCLQELRTKAI